MNRICLLALCYLVPVALMAQDTTNCSQLTNDLDGDLQIGAGDILMLLGSYGTYLDLDGDMIPDCQDDCVGAYDTCGVCNGPGPQVLAIDTIIITFDSIYAEAIDDWLIFELDRDTLLHLVCENPGCTDPSANNYDPYAEEGGTCTYGDFMQCGDMVVLDGYFYSTVLIGDQCWFAENLRTTTYADGTVIPAGLTDGEWTSTTSGATAVYGEGSSICDSYSPDIDACDEAQSLTEYGRLYNWYAVDDVRGLCPNGWHVPTDGEWTDLTDFLGGAAYAGTPLKASPDDSPGWDGTNGSGFSALPGGYRRYVNGVFDNAGDIGYWWSSSPGGGNAWLRFLVSPNPGISRDIGNLRFGFSVRCLRDAD